MPSQKARKRRQQQRAQQQQQQQQQKPGPPSEVPPQPEEEASPEQEQDKVPVPAVVAKEQPLPSPARSKAPIDAPVKPVVQEKEPATDMGKEKKSASGASVPAAAAESKENDKKSAGAPPEKSKEEVMAEREAKKAEKAARRAAAKQQQRTEGADKDKAQEGKENKKESAASKKEQQKPAGNESASAAPAVGGGEKTKAQLKAERRAKQEAQRAAKAAGGGGKEKKAGGGSEQQPQQGHQQQHPQAAAAKTSSSSSSSSTQRVRDDMQADRASVEKKLQRKLASAKIPARTKAQRKVMLFGHLHQYERELSVSRRMPLVGGTIHPAVVEVGLKYAEGTVSGSNARCVALLAALRRVVLDYSTPPHKELSRDLDARLKPCITFLKQCRPLSVSMGNAIRFVKARVAAVPPGMDDQEAKGDLVRAMGDFVHENIVLAARQIAITANTKIRDGDVILTYSCSSLLRAVLLEARRLGKRFRVVVADGRPRCEGREMARALTAAGVDVEYAQVSSLPYLMPEVTKAFLGAHAVLANGSVMSRVGTSQVALIAKAFHVPVLVCCETYKFSERVQTDSFVFNELGDPDDLVSLNPSSSAYPSVSTQQQQPPPLADWRDISSLCLLNLTYDVTPASLVDAVITEISVIPTTSVPVVLRLKNMEAASAH